jgi:hypothetical protein
MKKSVGLILVVLAVLGLSIGTTPVLAADKVDMTGTWNMEVETPAGSGIPYFVLKQEGDKITGTYSGTFGDAPVTGKVTGNQFVIEFESSGRKNVYTGTVDGNTCKGTIDISGLKGTFEGEKE